MVEEKCSVFEGWFLSSVRLLKVFLLLVQRSGSTISNWNFIELKINCSSFRFKRHSEIGQDEYWRVQSRGGIPIYWSRYDICVVFLPLVLKNKMQSRKEGSLRVNLVRSFPSGNVSIYFPQSLHGIFRFIRFKGFKLILMKMFYI